MLLFCFSKTAAMKFIEQYNQLKEIFEISQDEIRIPDSALTIRNIEFHAHMRIPSEINDSIEGRHICENIRFRYPVIMPGRKVMNNHAIVFLHGLNERSWTKHLTGARLIAEKTGRPVIMFPLSYHINRGLPEWTDVRKMAGLLEIRRQKYPDIKEASVINLALSERLTEHPERFFLSGLQSALDLIDLLKEIQEGRHPLFEKGTKTDIFAYSISCMLLQSMMISNPDDILSGSKIVFFAGGSIFSQIQGISKFIMDSIAFESIQKFYADVMNRRNSLVRGFQPWFMENKLGMAFRAILAPETLKHVRVRRMDTFHKNLLVIALRDDKVIPVEGIRLVTGERFFQSDHFRIVHFPYSYSHENPFPVLLKKIDDLVDKAFHSVFMPAIEFYMD